MSVSYTSGDYVVFTNKCRDKMAYYGLTEKDVLYAFNYPTLKTKAWYGTGMYHHERDYGDYAVTVVCFWNSKDRKWIFATCWKVVRKQWKPIKWWFAHTLGRV